MANYSHLCKEQRNTIEYLLGKNLDFTEIGRSINVDRTTISKEIRRNRIIKSSLFLSFSDTGITRALKGCEKLNKPPYCCNGCPNRSSCSKYHLYYNAKEAQKHYEKILKESREGVDITPEEVETINKNIVPLIKDKRQSVNQIYINHPDILYISKPTFYKYVNEGVILLNNLDLPKKVRYKKRKAVNKKNKRDVSILIGRRYEDYLTKIENEKKLNVWELDTVIGKANEAVCLMTFLLVETNFMLIRLLDKKDVAHVNEEFNILKNNLGCNLYMQVINIILTDNGSEFYDPINMEYDLDNGNKLCSVFYCHPNSPEEKSELEKNHEYIRRVLPKKSSFKDLTPNIVKKLEDNINNIPRDIFGGKTPYELTKEKYSEFIKKINAKYIKPDDVTLNPKDILEEDSNGR